MREATKIPHIRFDPRTEVHRMDEEFSSVAAIAVDRVEIGAGIITLRPAQELREGILPTSGGEEKRKVTISPCCLVDGHVFGNEVIVLPSDRRNLSTRAGEMLPGTQINGGINAFENITIGTGSVIRGGLLAGGKVTIDKAIPQSEGAPSRLIIEGAVSGKDIEIGDGVVILGPVVAQRSLKIGNAVTIRDYAISPEVTIGNGCLLGGLIAAKKIESGDFNTIASSRILLPGDQSNWSIMGDIRSPYPGCNNCPQADKLGGYDSATDLGRRLSCNYFSSINMNDVDFSVEGGACDVWTRFPIGIEEDHWILVDTESVAGEETLFTVVSNMPKNSVNMDLESNRAAIWELTSEASEEE